MIPFSVAAGVLALLSQRPPPDALISRVRELRGEMLVSRLVDDVWQVCRLELPSGNVAQLTFDSVDKRYPGWLPDGSVYYHTPSQECFRLVAGSDAAEPLLSGFWPLRDLTVSPDGSNLAFARVRTDLIDSANVWRTNKDGKEPLLLTNEPGIQYTPRFSPDGRSLAYVSGNGWGTYEVYTSGIDGTSRRRLTQNRCHDFLPAWSPDGQRIAFVSDRSGDYELWAMQLDGSSPVQLTRSPGLDTGPTWSPDGTSVAFTTNRSAKVELWCCRADGTLPCMLLDGARDAAWRPLPPLAESTASTLAIGNAALGRKTLLEPNGTTIAFDLSAPANVTLDIVDELGFAVRTVTKRFDSAGRHELPWDGRDHVGQYAQAGVYRYVLRGAEHERAAEVVLDPASEGKWGGELRPLEFTLDKDTGLVRWGMPKAGYVRLRAAVKNFPLLATLIDWEPREAGACEFLWDGRDAAGRVDLLRHPDLWVTLEIIDLPENAVLVSGHVQQPPLRPPDDAAYAPLICKGAHAHLAVQKPISQMREPKLSLEFPAGTRYDNVNRPILSGRVPLRIRLSDGDAAGMTDALFELAVYVDLTFVFEDEESTTPLTAIWDATSVPPGAHVLTINAFSYDGRIGTLCQSIVIEEQ